MAQAKTNKVTKTESTAKRAPGAASRAKGAAPAAHGVGRRKSSVARVWIRRGGTGTFTINGKNYETYFSSDLARHDLSSLSKSIPAVLSFNIEANVCGGGVNSQAGAVRLGVARALVAHDESLRSLLRQHGLLTVDARLKERKKYGRKAARRRFQFVKR